MNTITWNDFEMVELRVGTIISAKEFPEAKKPAYKLEIDFWPTIGIKKSSAQITQKYTKENLIGKQIIGVVNFMPKQVGPFLSECLVTGFIESDNTVILAVPDMPCDNGTRLA